MRVKRVFTIVHSFGTNLAMFLYDYFLKKLVGEALKREFKLHNYIGYHQKTCLGSSDYLSNTMILPIFAPSVIFTDFNLFHLF